ncbi:MAG: ribosome maturation factor RimP [Clostridia bacterium]|nr:ribosome maturation factor RimP [Clostridia bacterium]
MKTKSLGELKELLISIAQPMGIEVVDVEFKMSKNPSLTVYIDTEDGVDLDTCEKYHNAIDAPLDEFDFTLGSAYTLNVSSPGLDRPLKTERDFDRAMGQMVEIKLFAPKMGKKYFEGLLVDYDGNNITVEIEGQSTVFNISAIAKINLAIIFD